MRSVVLVGALALFTAGAPSLSHAQGISDPGARAFQYCYSCHSVDPDETAVLSGPNLFGVVGRPVASQDGFDYSDEMRAFGADGKEWTADLIAQFIQEPEVLVPGTPMQSPPGPRTEEERQALLGYLTEQR